MECKETGQRPECVCVCEGVCMCISYPKDDCKGLGVSTLTEVQVMLLGSGCHCGYLRYR